MSRNIASIPPEIKAAVLKAVLEHLEYTDDIEDRAIEEMETTRDPSDEDRILLEEYLYFVSQVVKGALTTLREGLGKPCLTELMLSALVKDAGDTKKAEPAPKPKAKAEPVLDQAVETAILRFLDAHTQHWLPYSVIRAYLAGAWCAIQISNSLKHLRQQGFITANQFDPLLYCITPQGRKQVKR